MKILIVDDEPGIRFVTRKILEKDGHKVLEAETGEEGIGKIRESKPDLVLLDVILPGSYGWEVCRRIKEDQDIKDVPVAMFTVRASEEDVKKSQECGAFAHMKKPFEKADLQRIVHSVRMATVS